MEIRKDASRRAGIIESHAPITHPLRSGSPAVRDTAFLWKIGKWREPPFHQGPQSHLTPIPGWFPLPKMTACGLLGPTGSPQCLSVPVASTSSYSPRGFLSHQAASGFLQTQAPCSPCRLLARAALGKFRVPGSQSAFRNPGSWLGPAKKIEMKHNENYTRLKLK